MRTYLILKEKVKRFNADTEIQALLKDLADPHGEAPLPAYSRAAADALKKRAFDRQGIAAKGLAYERLDQLVIDLLLGVR
jgi:xylose isomerase